MKVVTIGRSSRNNDIIVNDGLVSRNHLQIVMDDNGNYTVVDLGSTNGTYVNGQRIYGETVLQPGDEVRIGNTILPWQGYFASEQVVVEAGNARHTWMYIAAGLAVLLLLGAAVIWKLYKERPNPGSQPPELVQDSLLQRDAQEALANAEAIAQYEESLRDQYNRSEDLRAQENRQARDSIAAIQQRMQQQAQRTQDSIQGLNANLQDLLAQAQNNSRLTAQQRDSIANLTAQINEMIRQQRETEAALARQQREMEELRTQQMNREFDQLFQGVTRDNTLQRICDSWGIPVDQNMDAADKKSLISYHFHQERDLEQKARLLNGVREILGQPETVEPSATPDNGETTPAPNANTTTPSSPNNNGTNPAPNVQGTTPQPNNGGKTPAPGNNNDDDDFYDDDEDDDDGTSIRI